MLLHSKKPGRQRLLQPPVLGQRFAPALGFRGPGRLKAGLLTVASTARTRPSRFPNGGLSSLRTASAITAAVPFGACTRFPILRRIPDENGGTSSPVLLKLSIPIAARDVKSARRRPVNFSINSYGIPWSATPALASTGEEDGFEKAFSDVRSDSAGSGGRGLPSYERI